MFPGLPDSVDFLGQSPQRDYRGFEHTVRAVLRHYFSGA
jgi:hypothetical protein